MESSKRADRVCLWFVFFLLSLRIGLELYELGIFSSQQWLYLSSWMIFVITLVIFVFVVIKVIDYVKIERKIDSKHDKEVSEYNQYTEMENALQAYLKRFKCNEFTARFIDKNKIRIFDRTNNYIAIYDAEKGSFTVTKK